MSRARQVGEFYVVGGPVQPDRQCYVEREADTQLYWHLRNGEYCHVLAPRQMGKSSLMAMTVKRLRDDGRLVAVVDLTHVGAGERGDDPGRWYYSIAYRIVRELRLRADLQSWWHDRSTLTLSQRLTEFFREIVLSNTSSQLVIFVDEIESTLEVSHAQEFYAALRACHNARATEPDYGRLSFALLGVATAAQLAPVSSRAPFEVSRSIELGDFNRGEIDALAGGLSLPPIDAERVLTRIHHWTGGQPFLTQKLCRAAAGHGGEAGETPHVDQLVRERILAPKTSQEEPHLNLVRHALLSHSQRRDRVLTLYGRIRKGARVISDLASEEQDTLRLSGIVCEGADGHLEVRNRIYRHVFTPSWVNQSLPFAWRGFVAAAAVSLIAVALPIWYTQFLPSPYIATLSGATQDYELAMEAYRDLRTLPGFGATADRLLSGVMIRRSRLADDYASAKAADTGLRSIAGSEQTANRLMAEYWDRVASAAELAEQRDVALLYRLRALQDDTGRRRRMAAQLLDADYAQLVGTIRPRGPIHSMAMDIDRQTMTTVSEGIWVEVWSMMAPPYERTHSQRVSAQEFVQVQRDLFVDSNDVIRTLELSVRSNHPHPGRLGVKLRAPSGEQASFSLAQGSYRDGRYVFSDALLSELRRLRDGSAQGLWQLWLEDHEAASGAVLTGWSLRLNGRGDTGWREILDPPIALPPPRAANPVEVQLDRKGRWAAVWPARAGASGGLAVWDIDAGSIHLNLGKPDDLLFVSFALQGQRLIRATRRSVRVWDVATGRTTHEWTSPRELGGAWGLSPGERFLVIQLRSDEQGDDLLVMDLSVDAGVQRLSLKGHVQAVAVGAEGRWLATAGPDRRVKLVRYADRQTTVEILQPADVAGLKLDPANGWLAAVNNDGYLRVWALPESLDQPDGAPPRQLFQRPLRALESLSWADNGRAIALSASSEHFDVLRIPAGLAMTPTLHHSIASTSAVRSLESNTERVHLDLANNRLATANRKDRTVRVWGLPESIGPRNDTALSNDVVMAALHRDGRRLVLGTRSGSIRVRAMDAIHARNDDLGPVDFVGHTGEITALVISPQNNAILTGGSAGMVRLWDLDSGLPHPFLMRHPLGPIGAVAFSADGRTLVSGGPFAVRLWDASNGDVLLELDANDAVDVLTMSRDQRWLASGDHSGEMIVWDLDSGTEHWAGRGGGAIRALAINAAGSILAVGSGAGEVMLRRLADGSPLGRSLQLSGAVGAVRFSDNDRNLVVVSDAWAHYLGLSPQGLSHKLSRLLPLGGGAKDLHLLDSNGERIQLLIGTNRRRPTRAVLEFDVAEIEPIPGPGAELEALWQQRLQMRIDEQGEAVPLEHLEESQRSPGDV